MGRCWARAGLAAEFVNGTPVDKTGGQPSLSTARLLTNRWPIVVSVRLGRFVASIAANMPPSKQLAHSLAHGNGRMHLNSRVCLLGCILAAMLADRPPMPKQTILDRRLVNRRSVDKFGGQLKPRARIMHMSNSAGCLGQDRASRRVCQRMAGLQTRRPAEFVNGTLVDKPVAERRFFGMGLVVIKHVGLKAPKQADSPIHLHAGFPWTSVLSSLPAGGILATMRANNSFVSTNTRRSATGLSTSVPLTNSATSPDPKARNMYISKRGVWLGQERAGRRVCQRRAC
jgi:hypothetical protein